MLDILKVSSEEQIADVVELAREIWTEHYVPIIGPEQVDYMLDRFQSKTAVAAQIEEGHEYYTLSQSGRVVGYLAIFSDAEASTLVISKIYVLRSERGQGLGRAMLQFAEDVCRKRRINTMSLTVNKNNINSIACYTRMGFKNEGSVIQEIGSGFMMDDYRMVKSIGQK